MPPRRWILVLLFIGAIPWRTDCVAASEAERTILVVTFGDDATAPSDDGRAVYAAKLPAISRAAGCPVETFNAGHAGDTSALARARFARDVLTRDPDVVTIQLGSTDAIIDVRQGSDQPRVSLDDYAGNLRAMVAMARDHGVTPILLTPNPLRFTAELVRRFGAAPYDSRSVDGLDFYNRNYAAALRRVGEELGVAVLDVHEQFSRDPSGPEALLADGWSPNAAGHERVATALATLIEDLVDRGQIAGKVAGHTADASRDAGRSVDLVRAGTPLGVHAGAAPWRARPSALEVAPSSSLIADWRILRGNFEVRARLDIDRASDGEASLGLGPLGRLTIETGKRRVVGDGALFSAAPVVGSMPDARSAGELELILRREGRRIVASVDGVPCVTTYFTGELPRVSIETGQRSLRVVDWSMRGDLARAERPAAASYTIPLVDISGDHARRVVVDREPGQYLGHPTTVLLEDGRTMLCTYPKGHGRGAICMKRSEDGGLTWSERLPLPANFATSKEVPTLYRVVDKAGRRRLLLFSGLYPIRVASSEDDGHSWGALEPIGEFGGIVAMASLASLRSGDLLAFFHDDGRFLRDLGRQDGRFVVYATRSRDGGRTFEEPYEVATHPLAHLCEPGLVWSPDRRQMALLLRENSRQFNSFVTFSDDDGATWSPPRQLPAALTGDRHVARYAPDGRLFVTFRDTTRESPTQGDWVGWVGTYEDIVLGREGQYRVRIMDNTHRWDCAYPGLELLPDGTFVTTTYGHWEADEPPFVVSVRLRLDELDRLAASDPRGER